MLKVFLVEDEIVVREGIKNNIDWEKEGFLFAGEASDGELALPMIQEIAPDIIITDIKMPFMDGLELSRIVRKEQPAVKIIVLSGYNEFDYAKQAINIGITEYLLKPISPAKLLQAVKEVAEKIEKEREQQEYMNQFKREMLENKNIEKQKFFSDLVSREQPMAEILDRAGLLDMDLVSAAFNVVLFNVMRKGQTSTSYSEEIVKITEILEELAAENDFIYMFDRAGEGWGFLVLGDHAHDITYLKSSLFQRVIHEVQKYDNLEYFGGIGKTVQRLRELPESFDQANRAFSYRYMGKKDQIIHYEELGSMNLLMEGEIDLSTLDMGKIDRRILENFLKSGTVDEVRHFILDYFIGLGEDNINSLLFRQYIAMDMYFCTVAFVEEMGIKSDEIIQQIGEVKGVANRLGTVDSTRVYLADILVKAMKLRDSITMKKYDSLIDDATKYIQENYSNEDISLNSVAASVNLSPSYFSTIFSQEVGKTFVEYLTFVRMEKAKELLMCTNMKTSEIGYEVGYKVPHYFSYIFKKTQDCSPREFRTRS
ncbi:MAG: response regulator [Lachnospiraceae bacterium]|nr:response regulator [Lachnospiraceae bacterium]